MSVEDLVSLYSVEIKQLNKAVNRNIVRSPEKFKFQLNQEEYDNLRSQNVTFSLSANMFGRFERIKQRLFLYSEKFNKKIFNAIEEKVAPQKQRIFYDSQINTSDYGDNRRVQPSNIVKLKDGENIYLAVDTVDIKKLREFQVKGHCLQKNDKDFKLTPPEFEILNLRSLL